MKHEKRTVGVALTLMLAFALVGCSKGEEPNEVRDINAVTAELREQVDRGKLTREEAIVRLAQVTKEAKLGSGAKDKAELSPAFEAHSKELKDKVRKGELTSEEATAAWLKVAGTTKSRAETNDRKDSKRERK